MAIEPNAKYVPDVLWEYWGTVTFMLEHPKLYGMDDKRSDCHERLCEYYKLSVGVTREITDHLDKYRNAVEVHEALEEL